MESCTFLVSQPNKRKTKKSVDTIIGRLFVLLKVYFFCLRLVFIFNLGENSFPFHELPVFFVGKKTSDAFKEAVHFIVSVPIG